ncbi:MAG TPA: hypothetical protein VF677_03565 [Flavobacterium sp.]|jgi:hypothetical protein
MKVEIFIKPPVLNRVNILLSKLQFENTTEGKIQLSIAKTVALQFARKSFSLLGKDKSKQYKITVEYHEAELLERKLRFKANLDRELLQLDQDDYYLIINFCNYLNQKLT